MAARYLFVLLAVATLVIVDQFIVQPLLVRLDRCAPAINLSGRQRMLSQKLTKASLAIERSSQDLQLIELRNELRETLEQWTAAHSALQYGDPASGIEVITSPRLQEQWEQLKPHFVKMSGAANQLIESAQLPLDTSSQEAVELIIHEESQFLGIMEQIVKLMESEAAREVRRLRNYNLAIATAIVSLLLGLGWYVVRPATNTIRFQVDELESRVAMRTTALAEALESLRLEIVEREKAESNNQRLAAQLAHADRVESIGHLTVGLAHELNQPLGAISNYSEACDVLLGRPDGQADFKKLNAFIAQIRQTAMRAGQIVRRMRNFVQPDAGSTVEIDIRLLIAEIIALCRTEIDRAGVELTTDFTEQPTLVSVDPIQIQQVLVNLVQNALRALQDMPVEDRGILIRSSIIVDTVQVAVIDNGPGFLHSNAEVIFEPFHTSKADGLGIGLSICRSIIENHHGTISAKSNSDRGASVSFSLPLAPTHAACLTLQSDGVRGR